MDFELGTGHEDGSNPGRDTDEEVRCAFKAAGPTGDTCPEAASLRELRSRVEERFVPAWSRRAATSFDDCSWSVEGNCAGQLFHAARKKKGD